MDWGLANRLARMFPAPSGRTVMLAVDHGYFMGPTRRLENPRNTITPLLPYADALALTRGVLRTSVDPASTTPIVLRVSGGVTVLKEDLSDEAVTTSVREALRVNASAVALSVFVGAPHEHQSLVSLAGLVESGHDSGMPVMAITAVGKELEKRDARYLALACRVSAELGAHLVKTYYCEDFSKVVEGCPVPLVVAGGPKLDSEEAALKLARSAIDEGAMGIDMGRNIWQSDHPVAMLKGLRAIVHENATVREALDIVQEGRSTPKRRAAPVAT
ncbi:MAG TPA: 3-hydroxy-5-phosphonooxypentane-2,4-dione thiolase [Thermoplasmata archaeon]|nr:3-hydroxy-5-phosphonooxypentane-2,4-dione thiolase [Thermoplasmata archaeon]HEV2429831.1 3-hydroxy-5-phosphonooxypentane-2,4-dione thiolase [Thermoplasmata archaeon]